MIQKLKFCQVNGLSNSSQLVTYNLKKVSVQERCPHDISTDEHMFVNVPKASSTDAGCFHPGRGSIEPLWEFLQSKSSDFIRHTCSVEYVNFTNFAQLLSRFIASQF